MMRLWIVDDHDGGHSGAYGVVVAPTEAMAQSLFDAQLHERGLETSAECEYTLKEMDTHQMGARVLFDGNY